jgi:hypothetical protein
MTPADDVIRVFYFYSYWYINILNITAISDRLQQTPYKGLDRDVVTQL